MLSDIFLLVEFQTRGGDQILMRMLLVDSNLAVVFPQRLSMLSSIKYFIQKKLSHF